MSDATPDVIVLISGHMLSLHLVEVRQDGKSQTITVPNTGSDAELILCVRKTSDFCLELIEFTGSASAGAQVSLSNKNSRALAALSELVC